MGFVLAHVLTERTPFFLHKGAYNGLMNTSSPALEVTRLHKQYGHITALKEISLAVQPGEIFGLLGANGAGKSTLIHILVGALRPTSGEVRVLGMNPFRETAVIRQQIGFMPQAPALYEDLSARDNIRFFAQAHAIPNLKQRLDEILAFTDLEARQHDPVFGFSGGMKQRVSLACALVHRPRLLLLDEPSAGVDPQLREAFWHHFRQLAAEGVTILVSTHQMDEAMYCDRLLVMRRGVVLTCDTPRQLLLRGQTAVKIWRGDTVETHTLANAPETLPQLLQTYQLDPTISRLELEQETLDRIVLNLIQANETAKGSQ